MLRFQTNQDDKCRLAPKFVGAFALVVLSTAVAFDVLAWPGRQNTEYEKSGREVWNPGISSSGAAMRSCGASRYDNPIYDMRITSCFARPRGRGRGSYAHQGLDLNGPSQGPGAQVKAIANGRVRAAANMRGRTGYTVIMDHPNCPASQGGAPVGSQCVSVYRHLSRNLLVSGGSCVAVGTGLGSVGPRGADNGNVDPHLHLEIIANGVAYNPASFPAVVHDEHKCRTDMQTVSGRTPASLWYSRPQGGGGRR